LLFSSGFGVGFFEVLDLDDFADLFDFPDLLDLPDFTLAASLNSSLSAF
jgi:hypothetical protein